MEISTNDNRGIKIAFVSLGCDKNLIDSEVMLGIIDKEGYTITNDKDIADIIIVNTCGFILDATNEGIDSIITAGEYKQHGKCKVLIVTGCMAQRYKDEIFNELPEVDAVVGTGDFEQINKVIKQALTGEKVKLVTDINNIVNEQNSINRYLTTPPYFAYLKIAEGCDMRCTYCTIPSLRGKYRSRTIDSLIKETERLAKKGVKEIILVAQDTAIYGVDLYGETKLHELLQKLSKIDGIEWIRILYAYPENISDALIKEIAINPKVCNYIDMPIQHSSNNILKKMGRKSDKQKLKDIIGKLRKEIDAIIIRTTLIVGFPGETKEDYEDLYDFVETTKFDRLGIFTYSQEEGTPASIMDNQIDEDIKQARKDEIMELQKSISARKSSEKEGSLIKVIVEGKLPEEDVYCGRSYMDAYEVDGLIFFESDEDILAGEFRNIRITKSMDYDLVGVVEDEFAQ